MKAHQAQPHTQGRCPVDYTLQMVGGKWKPLILHRLSDGTLRFGQLQRLIPQVTQRVLTLQLRELERDGLITRTVFPEVPPRVEYCLTSPGQRLLPILSALASWLHDNAGELANANCVTPPAFQQATDSD